VNKNRNFVSRLGFAWNGIRSAFQQERSFRTQCILGSIAIMALAILGASPLWWAIFLILIASILSLELINTSLENLIDRVHHETHEQIALAKDCAAAAVLVLSGTSVVVFLIFLAEKWKTL
jgi:diacylglycerol kinase